ncbi:MAG: hypothetical protein A2945_02275 [Candidatus Liptonbacteria bacterium RIFCSPLOWO2_01_FULL_52_25]|uniref:Transcriptional regulator n=1 Tax=Candidatus Liptonbacteria bacterium RIFCSPLOWO2_01_FULL_52_25 TaxID=1798650 RepID=A0A1G2CGM3_9BACT|nr:MAG: hypothetical protein A2945_02275 [Candidatus Liptonbacteria bacterium RIFCSPLOWO2_01_FULL_52_25]
MSGHSHWAGIKHKKGATDQKRGVVFSKLLAAISAAAKTEQDPNFNPRLRTAVEKAREANVPADNIARAIKKASDAEQNLEELVFEAYGPGGIAILIEAISDSKNRTVQEIKLILNELGGKWAETGSVRWAFAPRADKRGLNADSHGQWRAKFPQKVEGADKEKLGTLIAALEDQSDVQNVYTNAL